MYRIWWYNETYKLFLRIIAQKLPKWVGKKRWASKTSKNVKNGEKWRKITKMTKYDEKRRKMMKMTTNHEKSRKITKRDKNHEISRKMTKNDEKWRNMTKIDGKCRKMSKMSGKWRKMTKNDEKSLFWQLRAQKHSARNFRLRQWNFTIKYNFVLDT